MLTDKAKEKFWIWLLNPETLKKHNLIGLFKFQKEKGVRLYYSALPTICQQALIVEWLDSINLVIDADKFSDECWQYSIDDGDFDAEYPNEIGFNSRPEALTKAIEKCNEIINLK